MASALSWMEDIGGVGVGGVVWRLIVLIQRDWKTLQGPGGWETASWIARGTGRRAAPHSLLSSLYLPHFSSPERDSCSFWQEPGPGSLET